jgi:hypothetical protein
MDHLETISVNRLYCPKLQQPRGLNSLESTRLLWIPRGKPNLLVVDLARLRDATTAFDAYDTRLTREISCYGLDASLL